MGSVNPPSPARIEEHKRALRSFLAVYMKYLRDGREEAPENRQRVIKTIPAAERAMQAAGVTPMVADPPALGTHRQVYSGLTNLAFKHEEPGFRPIGFSDTPAIFERVIDTVEQAIAELDQMEREERRRRRNPLHWIDRAIRYVLAIPAYIVSRIVGTSVEQIDRSSWGLLLRVIGLVADGCGSCPSVNSTAGSRRTPRHRRRGRLTCSATRRLSDTVRADL